MGPSTNVDMEAYGFLEGEFADYEDLSKLSGNIMIKISAGLSQEWQTIVVNVPVVFKMSLDAEVNTMVSLGWDYSEATIYMEGELDIVLPNVKLSSGVGVTQIADVSVYGSASNNVAVDFDDGVTIATLKGEAGISVKALVFESAVPLISGSYQYYHSGASVQSTYSTFSTQEILDEENYTINRSNLDTQSDWFGDDRNYSLFSDPTMNEPTLLQSSVYANANPLMVETESGTQVLVWTADIEDRADGNHTAVVYSINSGDSWSEPVIIEDDGTADFYPTATTLGDDVYVSWMDTKEEFDSNFDLDSVAKSCEITVAKLSGDEWTMQTLTNDDVLDIYPNLNTVDDTVYLVWVTNSENDVLSMTGSNQINYATSDNWESEVYTTVSSPITEFEVGQVGSQVVISYIMIDDDISLYAGAINGNPSLLDTGDLTGSSFEKLNGNSILLWAGQDFASYTKDMTNIIDLSISDDTTLPEFIQILTIGDDTYLVGAIGTDENGMYSYQLDGNTVGDSVLMLDLSERYLTSMSAVQGDNGLDVVYLSTEVIITEDSVDETPDIYVASLTSYTDVALVSGYYESDTDTGTPVVLTLQNTGLTTADEVTIEVIQNGSIIANSVQDIDLSPGATTEITVEIPLEERNGSDIDYTFTVTVADDVDLTNDSLDLTVGLVDVSVDTTLLSGGEAISATVAVTNEGDLDTVVTLNVYMDSVDGELLDSYRCGEIAIDTTEYFQLSDTLLREYAYQGVTLCFEIQSYDTEEILFNNVSYEYISQGHSAISATLENVSTSNGEIEVNVEFSVNEVGCILVVASYADGQMIEKAIKQVEIGEENTEISLLEQGNENDIVVYILDQNWQPLLDCISLSYNVS